MGSNELVTKKAQAAVLEAQGASREDIVRVTGSSASTVARWRRDEKYRADVEEMKKAQLEAIEPLLMRLKVGLLDASHEAVQSLRDQLKAGIRVELEDDDGNKTGEVLELPDWAVRSKAAEIILRHASPAKGGDQQPGGGASAQAAVIVVKDSRREEPSITVPAEEV